MDEGRGDDNRVTRGQWLQRSFSAGSALTVSAIVLGGRSSAAHSSASRSQDREVLSLLLAFERLEADFFAQALRELPLRGEWLQYARTVVAHERAHVSFLRQLSNAMAGNTLRFSLGRSPASIGEFSRLAVVLEDLGVALYNGQAANLTSPSLSEFGRIMSVEARHAAWARDLAGLEPAPVASDAPADASGARKRLIAAGVSVGG